MPVVAVEVLKTLEVLAVQVAVELAEEEIPDRLMVLMQPSVLEVVEVEVLCLHLLEIMVVMVPLVSWLYVIKSEPYHLQKQLVVPSVPLAPKLFMCSHQVEILIIQLDHL
tara:strand:+ start:697 stop:1026 length:330 start_codon:yes stop_codon:yes gene_type:complete